MSEATSPLNRSNHREKSRRKAEKSCNECNTEKKSTRHGTNKKHSDQGFVTYNLFTVSVGSEYSEDQSIIHPNTGSRKVAFKMIGKLRTQFNPNIKQKSARNFLLREKDYKVA